jgi:hypothetical protein
MRQNLGVAAACERMTFPSELIPNGLMVVQLAVLDRPDRARLVGDWLMTTSDVNDAQPSYA